MSIPWPGDVIFMDPTQLMDNIYRHQRRFYDLTRKFFLLGRDRLLDRLPVEDGGRVLEIGCGTGRNLAVLARKRPGLHLFGLDASSLMLETAGKKFLSDKPASIRLAQGLAEEFDLHRTFDLTGPMDAIFFSYSLSMIPLWREAVDAALNGLKTGGSLLVVDFWDQRKWPGFCRWPLQYWLKLFHVHYRPELPAYLESLERQGRVTLDLEPVWGRYAWLAIMAKID